MARMWDINDLAGTYELAQEFGLVHGAVCNWVKRYRDFPKPVLRTNKGNLYSRKQVRAWYRSKWDVELRDVELRKKRGE